MTSDAVEPRLGLESFSCPHCNVVAHQEWFFLLLKNVKRIEDLATFTPEEALKSLANSDDDEKGQKLFEQFIERLGHNAITYRTLPYQQASTTEMVNLHLSHCYNCRGFAVWVQGQLVYPIPESAALEEMPPSVRKDFEEAAAIVDKSPRGAAALMRFCIHKMLLNEQGKGPDDSIASLVSKGLEVEIQQAMDALRVLDSEAAYPSRTDLKDDKVLELLNSIIKRRG
jgi:hypothetical protein